MSSEDLKSQRETWPNPDSLDHVVGVGAGAAGAVATQRAVNVGGEVVGEVGDLKAALQTRLPAHDTPVEEQTKSYYCLRGPQTVQIQATDSA